MAHTVMVTGADGFIGSHLTDFGEDFNCKL